MPFCSASEMNSLGGDEPVLRMLPARQRLEAEHLAVDRRLRLVVQEQLVARDRRAQIELQRVALAQAAVHLGVEEAHHLAAVGLGAVERGVGIGEQRRRCRCRRADRPRAPMLRPMRDLAARDLEGLGNGLQQAARPAPRRPCGCSACRRDDVNSSPPTRAMKAPSAATSSRRATAHSSSSPTTWPNTSLASLK